MRELMISEYEAGQRFDKFLAKYMELAPKSFFYKMMRKKNITLNGKKAAGNEKLEKGDTVKLFLAEETIEGFREKKKRTVHTGEKLDILYEDEQVMLINKPAGMLSQKAEKNDVSMVEHLISHLLDTGEVTEEMLKTSIDELENAIKRANIVMLPGGFSAGDEPEGSGKFIATVLRNPRLKAAISDLLDNRDGLMIGICNGFQALIKLGLLPYGEIRDMSENDATLTFNTIGRHLSQFVDTRIGSVKSPWLANVNVGDVHVIPISHGEGRFVAPKEVIDELFANGQVFSQYVDPNRKVTMQTPYNPNGSMYAIEGIVSRDGRVLGKMGHSERQGENRFKNVYGEMDQKLFEAGVNYFRGGK